ncbi:hydrogenase iron-sulfur subunit [candidate division KSB1 bacterium]
MKIGIFLSRDYGVISETVNVDALAVEYSNLAVTKVYDSFFSYEDQQNMLKAVDENSLESIVLAGNSPKYFDSVFNGNYILEKLKNCGINENKIAFANIKEQAALPHEGENEIATKKARLLIDAALAKLEICHNIESLSVSPMRSVLVIGTTAGGLIAAKLLLDKGYKVYLLEKEESIQKQKDIKEDLLPTITVIQSDARAKIFFTAEIEDVYGWCGDYKVTLSTPAGKEEIWVGGIMLCVGDNTEWIKELKPKMQLDTDDEGLLRGVRKKSHIGRTRDPGIWFVPYRKESSDHYASEANGAGIAVLSLTTILDRNEIEHRVLISEVDENVCGGCGTCVKTCAFSASSIDQVKKVSVIDPKRCKGCGNCVVACPTGARDLISFPEKYIFKTIDIFSNGVIDNSEPKVLAIFCNSCGYPALDMAGELSSQFPDLKYSPNLMPVLVECGGNVDTQYILRAFSKGFDGVAISICRDGHCHHIVGNTDMERRVGLFREVLRSRNIDDERLRIIHVSPDEGKLFSEEIISFFGDLKKINFEKGGSKYE